MLYRLVIFSWKNSHSSKSNTSRYYRAFNDEKHEDNYIRKFERQSNGVAKHIGSITITKEEFELRQIITTDLNKRQN